MGLREGDLEHLVLPLISVDEYESKLSQEAIVIGFYVGDQEPARDLNRFIQKAPIALLDTDISPAPNRDGYYMVFVELMRNDEVPEKVIDLCGTISNLVKITDWSMSLYGQDKPVPLSSDGIKAYMTGDEISQLDNATVEEGIVTFQNGSMTDRYVVEHLGDWKMDPLVLSPCTNLLRMLGEGWDVVATKDKALIAISPSGKMTKLRKL